MVLLDRASDISSAVQDLADLKSTFEGDLSVDEATYIVAERLRDVEPDVATKSATEGVYRIVYADEYDSSTCPDRPEPVGYDGDRLREVKARYVIVRPDRFIFASCNTSKDLVNASRSLVEMLSCV